MNTNPPLAARTLLAAAALLSAAGCRHAHLPNLGHLSVPKISVPRLPAVTAPHLPRVAVPRVVPLPSPLEVRPPVVVVPPPAIEVLPPAVVVPEPGYAPAPGYAQAPGYAPAPGYAQPPNPWPASAETLTVDLLSSDPYTRWDVYYDDEVICSTPCNRQLDPGRPLLFRARDGRNYGRGGDQVLVPDLVPFIPAGRVQVSARPTAQGKFATGVVFTSLGGMAAVTGTVLTAVGCSSSDRMGLCKGGGITLAAGALVLAGSITMIVDSLPHAEFRVPGGGMGSVTVGPGFANGTF